LAVNNKSKFGRPLFRAHSIRIMKVRILGAFLESVCSSYSLLPK